MATAFHLALTELPGEFGGRPHFLASLAHGGRVLELAIGTGRVALPLAARGIAVEGVEASYKMAAKLRAKPGAGRRPFGADSADHVSVYRLGGGCP